MSPVGGRCLTNLVVRSARLQGLNLILRESCARSEWGVVELPRRAEDRGQALEVLSRQVFRGGLAPLIPVRIRGSLRISHARTGA